MCLYLPELSLKKHFNIIIPIENVIATLSYKYFLHLSYQYFTENLLISKLHNTLTRSPKPDFHSQSQHR